MWFSQRDKEIKENNVLEEIDKEFSVLEKLSNIFELFFDCDGQLNIVEGCDGYFCEFLTIEDLKQLSKYFLKVANYMEKRK